MSTKPKPVALIDMDGTLADFHGALHRDMKSLQGPGESELEDLSLIETTPYLYKRAAFIKRSPNWWYNLSPIPSGMQMLGILHDLDYKMVILTRGPKNNPGAWEQKMRWVEDYVISKFPHVKCVVTSGDKSQVMGAVLVDDWPDYVSPWLKTNPNGIGMLPSRYWNSDFVHASVCRYEDNQTQAYEMLRKQRGL